MGVDSLEICEREHSVALAPEQRRVTFTLVHIVAQFFYLGNVIICGLVGSITPTNPLAFEQLGNLIYGYLVGFLLELLSLVLQIPNLLVDFDYRSCFHFSHL
jgi:hypothetical protein